MPKVTASMPTVLTDELVSNSGVPSKFGSAVVVVAIVLVVVVAGATVLGAMLAGATVPTVVSGSSPPHAVRRRSALLAIAVATMCVRHERDRDT